MEKLTTTTRHRKSGAEHTSLLAATQSDRARLVYSAPFRRLQQKAQVFSLESNSAVRSRLTHSLEVSHIGRYIVSQILEMISDTSLPDEEKTFWNKEGLAISNIVETACLMHDIGNPPFGHFGEAAISQWFCSKDAIKAITSSIGDTKLSSDVIKNRAHFYDFEYFDGNPQGLRIVTKLQGDDGKHGLNLTSTQIASFLKYTFNASRVNSEVPFGKKAGYFSTENELMTTTWEHLGMRENSRHPLSFLMEASDDISYCISDIEDGIEKKIISEQQFLTNVKDKLEDIIENKKIIRQQFLKQTIINLEKESKKETFTENQVIMDLKSSLEVLDAELLRDDATPTIAEKLYSKIVDYKVGSSVGAFIYFKTSLSNLLVKFVADSFLNNYSNFANQEFNQEIIHKGTCEYKVLKILRDFTSKHLFSSDEAESIELAGFSAISGLLKDFSKLLEIPREYFNYLLEDDFSNIKKCKLDIHMRLFHLLPERHISAYKNSCNQSVDAYVEWNLRSHLIIDFISGMTDHFALETYHTLKGIKLA